VRIRSGLYSLEVYDDQFILSPRDKIWFQIQEDEKGPYLIGEQISANGIRLDPLLLNEVNFTAGSPIRDMTMGYIEVFGIAQADNAADLNNRRETKYVENVLMGGMYLGDFTTGEYVGYNMTAIANFRTVGSHRDLLRKGTIDKYYPDEICYPQWKSEGTVVSPADPLCIVGVYDNGDWATTHGPSWNDGDDLDGSGDPLTPDPAGYTTAAAAAAFVAKANLGPSANYSLDEVESCFWKAHIKSDYFNRVSGIDSETVTLGVVTFPAKYLHFNYKYWNPGIGTWNSEEATKIRKDPTKVTKPDSVPIVAGVWDMDENAWGHSPSVTKPLPWEVNLIPVGDLSQKYFDLDPWFLAYYASPFDAQYSEGYEWGWFSILFKDIGWTPYPFNLDLVNFVRGESIYPANNLVMHYETYGELKARAFSWQYYDWHSWFF
jgi:hypothetical protein